MGRKRKPQVRRSRVIPRWWESLGSEQRRRVVRVGAKLVLISSFVLAGAVAVARVERYVDGELNDRACQPTLAFVDLPEQLADLSRADLQLAVSDLLAREWTDDDSCREMAGRFSEVGWIAKLNFVRRAGDGRFEVSAHYRIPVAMVRQNDEFMLVDAYGVRLPGTYLYKPTWKLIQGVEKPAPQPGAAWEGADLKAGLEITRAIEREAFGSQVTGVLVENLGGRRNSARAHVELATDRPGGRIRWGSAPGSELEENTLEQKLALLRETHRQTGRVDAGHLVVDISTFPDRFTIPG